MKSCGFFPGQGTYQGFGFDSWLGYIWEATGQSLCLSVSLLPSSPCLSPTSSSLSLSIKINKNIFPKINAVQNQEIKDWSAKGELDYLQHWSHLTLTAQESSTPCIPFPRSEDKGPEARASRHESTWIPHIQNVKHVAEQIKTKHSVLRYAPLNHRVIRK